MLKKPFASGPFSVFYIVVVYIIVFSIWWAYLLYDKNETAYKEKIELHRVNFNKNNPRQDYNTTEDYLKISSKYQRQKLMIIGEGSVFILLLIIGLWQTRKVFRQEIQLAEQQKNFLLSITHEFKSPLSTIKLSLQTMAKRKLEPEKSEKLIANSLVDLDRLEALVDNILFAAKIERDEPGFSDDEVNISELTHLSVERFSHNKKAILVEEKIQPDVYLHVDGLGYTSVIINLIENAVKYSEPESVVTVKVSDDADRVYLSVTDTGMGIPEVEKKKVFDKFYRVGNEDTRKTKGTGLGLYIVKRFVEIYGGVIEIDDNVPTGSIFRLSFQKRRV